ncbi:MAG TPA: amino acid permease, partial [Acidobacteriota bacterium]|nr:amino acid permease [Acidobacteriota bacterium]
CGALTLAELSSLIPKAGSSYHIIREAYGEFAGFLKIWVEMLVSGPGSVAGVAIAFGAFLAEFLPSQSHWTPTLVGSLAILFFASINLQGVRWGGRTQITLTLIKIVALLGLVFGSFLFAPAAITLQTPAKNLTEGVIPFLRFIGLGVAAVLFTYDGWVDVTHTAGEISDPKRNLPRGLAAGVGAIIVLYLLVNVAYLRVVRLEKMREAPAQVAFITAETAFGPAGASLLKLLITVSIFGALGGVVMTLPRLYYGVAARYQERLEPGNPPHRLFSLLGRVDSKSFVPSASIVFCAVVSLVALLSFRSFGRIVNFFVVPLQLVNILMVASVFRLRKRTAANRDSYLTPAYPFVPLVFVVVMALFLVSAIYYNPKDTLIGIVLASISFPVYRWIHRYELRR